MKRVLILEKDQKVREAIYQLVLRMGHEADAVHTHELAAGQFQDPRLRPHLLICYWEKGDQEGEHLELLSGLLQTYEIPVLVYTDADVRFIWKRIEEIQLPYPSVLIRGRLDILAITLQLTLGDDSELLE